MIFLAIDTSTEICSVAIQTPSGDIFEAAHTQSTHHAQAILPLIERILSQANLGLADLNYLAVSVGPGSFTGVRAGIATAQGLTYGLNIPVIPIGTLELVALGANHSGHVQVIMDARMQQFYVASFKWEGDTLVTVQTPCLLSEPELLAYLSKNLPEHPDTQLLGTGLMLVQDKIFLHVSSATQINTQPDLNRPQAKNLIKYLNQQVRARNLSELAIKPAELVPLYIRNDVAAVKRSS